MERTFVFEYLPKHIRGYAFSWRLFDFIKRVKNGNVTELAYKRLLYFFDVHGIQSEISIVITEHLYPIEWGNESPVKKYSAKMNMNLSARYISKSFIEQLDRSQILYNFNLLSLDVVSIEITTRIDKVNDAVSTIELLERNRQRG